MAHRRLFSLSTHIHANSKKPPSFVHHTPNTFTFHNPSLKLDLSHSDRVPLGSSSPIKTTTFTLSSPSRPLSNTSFTARWVRDSDVSHHSINPSTRQKFHPSDKPDPAISLRSTEQSVRIIQREELERMGEQVAAELGPCLRFDWQTDGQTVGQTPYSLIPLSYFSKTSPVERLIPKATPWASSELSSLNTLFIPYETYRTDQGLHTALSQLSTHGIVFLKDVPTEETGNERCELRKVANRIGELRNTFYGETWDVRSLGTRGRNVAYTDVPLGLHMDLLYFENPPQFQFLHSLRAKAQGGASYFLDTFHAAHQLYLTQPKAFDILRTIPVPYHYRNDGHHLQHAHPVIELLPASTPDGPPPIKHINYSPPFQAALPSCPSLSDDVQEALTLFEEELGKADRTFEYRMEEGDLVMFDNRRVVHARRGFTEVEGEGVQRWLKGCYVDGDAGWDRLRVLEQAKRNGEWV